MLTFQDVVVRLRNSVEGAALGRDSAVARTAIAEALRDLANACDWSWYKTLVRVAFAAPYTTGTIAYDHTGGTHERQLTLSSGTWPTWSDLGVITIDDVTYDIQRRVSDTVLVLAENDNPGADVSSGTTYSLAQQAVRLPYSATGVYYALNETYNFPMEVISAERFAAWTRGNSTVTGSADAICLIGDPYEPDRMLLRVADAPSAVTSISALIKRQPRALRIENGALGTVTNSAGSTTLTASTAVFTAAHVGCIVRVSGSATAPTDIEGTNIYDEERVITAVTSSTVAVVNSAFTSAHSAVGWTLSDPVDIHIPTMESAFNAGCEWRVALRRKQESAGTLQQQYVYEIGRARAAHVTARTSSSAYDTEYSASWKYGGANSRLPMEELP